MFGKCASQGKKEGRRHVGSTFHSACNKPMRNEKRGVWTNWNPPRVRIGACFRRCMKSSEDDRVWIFCPIAIVRTLSDAAQRGFTEVLTVCMGPTFSDSLQIRH